MFLFNNVKINFKDQRTIGDVQYPAGWFNDANERAKVGMIEVPDPVRPDESLFTSIENPDGSYTATPRSDADIAAYKAQKNDRKAAEVRAERNVKLTATDWTQIADSPVNKEVWAFYRQCLRDITTSAGFPWEINWPVQP